MKKEFNFNWDVSALANYTDQSSLDLISKAILDDPTSRFVTIEADVKSAKDIHTIESDPLGATAGSAGFSSSGTTDLGKVTLSVGNVKVNQILDPYLLNDKYTQMALKPGSILDEVPFEQAVSEEKAKQVAKLVAKQVWQGDTVSGSGDLSLNVGFIKSLADDATTIQGATGATAWNSTNIIASVQSMISSLNADVLAEDDLVMFLSPSYYRTLTNALFAGNYFHFSSDETVNGEFMFPGTNVRIVRTYGLQGSSSHSAAVNSNDCVVLGSAKYLYWGTDLVSDYSSFRLFYSQDNDDVRFIARWKVGAAHLFGLYFVVNF